MKLPSIAYAEMVSLKLEFKYYLKVFVFIVRINPHALGDFMSLILLLLF